MATIGEFIDETSRIIDRGENAFENLEMILRAKVPLHLKQAPYRRNEFFFLEITVVDPNRAFLFYKRVFRSTSVKELKEMLFMRYAVPPKDQAWIINGDVLQDKTRLFELHLEKVAMFCPVHVRVFRSFTWPTQKQETLVQGPAAWTCSRCKMQNWSEIGSECTNCLRQKEGRNRDEDVKDESDLPKDMTMKRSRTDVDEGDVRVRDMSDNLVEKMGWSCPKCTLKNNPTRPGCIVCGTDRPDAYRPPTDRAIDTAHQNSKINAPDASVHRPQRVANPFWKCQMCEFQNPLSVAACKQCTFERIQREPVVPKSAPKSSPQPFKAQRADSPDMEDSLPFVLKDPKELELVAKRRRLIKEAFGWKCPACMRTNEPNDKNCEECKHKRPYNYKVPTERERQNLMDTMLLDEEEPPAPAEQSPARRKSPPINAPQGWECPACSFLNRPRRPGCEICGGEPPADYDINQAADDPEEEERVRLQRENEMNFIKTENERQELELRRMAEAADANIIPPDNIFECPVCFGDVEPIDGVRLRNCLHDICKECLIGMVTANGGEDIECCECAARIDDRDMRNVLPPEVWERRLNLTLKMGEADIENTFHCLTPNCAMFVEIVDEVNFFECGVCNAKNCLTCKAQHGEKTCEEYQEDLKRNAQSDEDARKTLEMFERMITDGEAMRCPKCGIVLQKKEGCDWMRCSSCRTEICWATKGFRWGPKGKGDDSGGCRCKVGGRRCHPLCCNCH